VELAPQEPTVADAPRGPLKTALIVLGVVAGAMFLVWLLWLALPA
jgi:hypothetical protein